MYIFLDKEIGKKKFLASHLLAGGSWQFFISSSRWIGNKELLKVGLTSNCINPYTWQPTRLTSISKTLIDNIFWNVATRVSCETISGNITTTISDHLPQFLFAPNVISNPLCKKSNILKRDWSKFNKENFILDYFDKNWSEILQLDQHNVNISMDSYLDHMNAILDIHAPYKKVNKYKLRFKIKPWITPALQNSISVKNSLLKKFINCNDSQTKESYILDIRNIEIFFLPFSK